MIDFLDHNTFVKLALSLKVQKAQKYLLLFWANEQFEDAKFLLHLLYY